MKNREYLEKKTKMPVAAYSNEMDQLNQKQLDRIASKAEYLEKTDVKVRIENKCYIVEIDMMMDGMDYVMIPAKEYKGKQRQ